MHKNSVLLYVLRATISPLLYSRDTLHLIKIFQTLCNYKIIHNLTFETGCVPPATPDRSHSMDSSTLVLYIKRAWLGPAHCLGPRNVNDTTMNVS